MLAFELPQGLMVSVTTLSLLLCVEAARRARWNAPLSEHLHWALATAFVLLGYRMRIELEYGRKIDTYKDTIAVGGEPREVDILRVGRIALLYQTPDQRSAGFWNPTQGGWEPLEGNAYRGAIRQGMRMANKQASIELLTLPVAAPGATR